MWGGGALKDKSAFTLIELLVVVLIIGILVAVALPQYRKATLRSQASQSFLMLKAIADAQRRYLLERGTYAIRFSDLDIDVPGTITYSTSIAEDKTYGDWVFELSAPTGDLTPGSCLVVNSFHTSGLNIRFDFYSGNQNFFCVTPKGTGLAQSVCAMLGKSVTCPVFCGNSWMVGNRLCWQL